MNAGEYASNLDHAIEQTTAGASGGFTSAAVPPKPEHPYCADCKYECMEGERFCWNCGAALVEQPIYCQHGCKATGAAAYTDLFCRHCGLRREVDLSQVRVLARQR